MAAARFQGVSIDCGKKPQRQPCDEPWHEVMRTDGCQEDLCLMQEREVGGAVRVGVWKWAKLGGGGWGVGPFLPQVLFLPIGVPFGCFGRKIDGPGLPGGFIIYLGHLCALKGHLCLFRFSLAGFGKPSLKRPRGACLRGWPGHGFLRPRGQTHAGGLRVAGVQKLSQCPKGRARTSQSHQRP